MTEEEQKKEQEKIEEQPKKTEKDNIVFIGQKPFMNYVNAVITQFKTNKEAEVIIRARGKFISRAADVSEVATKRFLKEENIKAKKIEINSEEFENKEGKKVNVSTIDIILGK